MKCVGSCSTAILALFLIIQINGYKIFDDNKLNQQYMKIHDTLVNTGTNLLKLRIKSFENLELALSNAVESFDNFINNDNNHFQQDIEIVMYCLTETSQEFFHIYQEEKLAIKQLHDENLTTMELTALSYFKVGSELNAIANKTMTECENKKHSNTLTTCIAPNFQSITRNTISYSKNTDEMIKLGNRLEGEMKHQCDESLKRFQEYVNITGKIESCLKKTSTVNFSQMIHELQDKTENMKAYYYETSNNNSTL